ncbi:uncharacterized protein A1O5_06584 [Cladophialophora psammophila CBS 110553]|uniref:Uncharacterized protein n=1 Tax=Cladophialophora psammophila CBS 110553 TaxID=1182543 RepID=W9WZM0_9EURO|nr:uncharacterized protein A1O5_06584 [Cladophialophora psammophila CBS 110553]EXJ70515.1 hypothetical protein A1O5_06584 [Cladophialophora psammophila CBS 110553]
MGAASFPTAAMLPSKNSRTPSMSPLACEKKAPTPQTGFFNLILNHSQDHAAGTSDPPREELRSGGRQLKQWISQPQPAIFGPTYQPGPQGVLEHTFPNNEARQWISHRQPAAFAPTHQSGPQGLPEHIFLKNEAATTQPVDRRALQRMSQHVREGQATPAASPKRPASPPSGWACVRKRRQFGSEDRKDTIPEAEISMNQRADAVSMNAADERGGDDGAPVVFCGAPAARRALGMSNPSFQHANCQGWTVMEDMGRAQASTMITPVPRRFSNSVKDLLNTTVITTTPRTIEVPAPTLVSGNLIASKDDSLDTGVISTAPRTNENDQAPKPVPGKLIANKDDLSDMTVVARELGRCESSAPAHSTANPDKNETEPQAPQNADTGPESVDISSENVDVDFENVDTSTQLPSLQPPFGEVFTSNHSPPAQEPNVEEEDLYAAHTQLPLSHELIVVSDGLSVANLEAPSPQLAQEENLEEQDLHVVNFSAPQSQESSVVSDRPLITSLETPSPPPTQELSLEEQNLQTVNNLTPLSQEPPVVFDVPLRTNVEAPTPPSQGVTEPEVTTGAIAIVPASESQAQGTPEVPANTAGAFLGLGATDPADGSTRNKTIKDVSVETSIPKTPAPRARPLPRKSLHKQDVLSKPTPTSLQQYRTRLLNRNPRTANWGAPGARKKKFVGV